MEYSDNVDLSKNFPLVNLISFLCRYNEMTMEEDQPVCEIVTETKCDETTTNSK